MIRKIILPQYFDTELDHLARKRDIMNCNGIYICVPWGENDDLINYPVSARYLTSVSHHIYPDRHRRDLFNLFFRKHPQYKPIMWHKHSVQTYSFPANDLDYYHSHVKKNPDFVGMLAYPGGRLIYSSASAAIDKKKHSIEMQVIPNPYNFAGGQREIEALVMECARELGMGVLPVLGRRR